MTETGRPHLARVLKTHSWIHPLAIGLGLAAFLARDV
jgi:hypothetical protein